MFSLQPDQELDRIAAGLSNAGAFSLLLVDAAPLERIERRYGADSFRTAMDNLKELVGDLCSQIVGDVELLITEERSRASIAAFIFCPRSNHHFYSVVLDDLAERVTRELALRGRRAVYPYFKQQLDLAVGRSIVLFNPTVKPERQILQAVEDARDDAVLEQSLRDREHNRLLQNVILTSQVNVRYEAVVDIHNAQVLGYEALTRGPEGTDLSTPRELFRRAEDAGLLYELDCLCRKAALEGAHRIPADTTLFLNCLPTAIGDPNLRDEGLRKLLETFDLRPSNLVLEISESESIENFGAFREVADSCREVGIRIAIDDAGTGYASLEAIMAISPDFIKTDLALARGIDEDRSRQEVVRAIRAVARGIGAKVIAEGIESEAELRTLRGLEVDYGQGFYFGAAVRADGVGG